MVLGVWELVKDGVLNGVKFNGMVVVWMVVGLVGNDCKVKEGLVKVGGEVVSLFLFIYIIIKKG